MHYLESLNSAQRRAVEHTEGPLLILAGAGAGKTKTLTNRIFHLIKKGVSPAHILAITFTNKAAKEMKERITSLISSESAWAGEQPFVSTFHALGVYLLRNEHEHHSRTRYFSIADSKDTLSMVKEAVKELGLDPKIHEPKKIRSIISSQKNKCKNVEMYTREGETHLASIVASIWKRYEEMLAQENAYDFDDLLFETVKLLETKQEVREKYTKLWKYIHIDEYQDTNETQYRIAKVLGSHGNICVVGDGDQTIYTWRGADVTNILNFEQDYPDALVVVLEENYRSTQNILLAANAVISKNTKRKEKNLFTKNKEGDFITVFEAASDRAEALFAQQKINGLLRSGVDCDDIAILYRANFQSRLLEETMLSGDIPYIVLGVRFFDRAEVKDVLSYLRAAYNKESLTDIKRIINTPKRGIGKVTIAKLFAGQKEDLPAKTLQKINEFYSVLEKIYMFSESHLPSETIRFVLEESGLRKELVESGTEDDLGRVENMEELITFALKYDHLGSEGIAKMIEDAALASDQDSLSSDEQDKKKQRGVRLMTVHASKGLEFPYVFVVGMEQDLFPHSFDGQGKADSDDEEERRLFYVALTRAEEKIFLSHATLRYIHGEQHIQEPSEFLRDIPEEIVDREYDTVSFRSRDDDFGDSDGPMEYLVID
jgi:DNA helicase-2/ATP-dependent DNA helicase PcrA